MKYELNANILPDNLFSKLWSYAFVTLMPDSCGSSVVLIITTGAVISGVLILGDVAVLYGLLDSSSKSWIIFNIWSLQILLLGNA